MVLAVWRQWAKRPELERTLADRARGTLPEMESTKQLVRLIEQVYRPGMTVLDVGCNTGHYLRGLRRRFPTLAYTGVDAYACYIEQAQAIFADDAHARFAVRDVFQPLFPDVPFDIVFCCNLLLHLPDFRVPVRNLLANTRRACLMRTLLGPQTTIVKCAMAQTFTDEGEPLDFVYKNTWQADYFTGYIRSLGWRVELIPDEFDPSVLQQEYTRVKQGRGTRVVDGKQVDGATIFNWVWAKVTPEQ